MTTPYFGMIPRDARDHRALAAELGRLARMGICPPCAGSSLPTSDDPADRAQAIAMFCARCTIVDACRAAGRHEVFGVWGGRDREVRKVGRPQNADR